MSTISDLELACIHESAHAVLAFNCKFHGLHDRVRVHQTGHGDSPFYMKRDEALAEYGQAGNADKVFEKAAIIAAAGVCAENRLRRERGATPSPTADAFKVSRADVEQAELALSRMVVPKSFDEVVGITQRVIDTNDKLWAIICDFADVLREKRVLDALEAGREIQAIELRHAQTP